MLSADCCQRISGADVLSADFGSGLNGLVCWRAEGDSINPQIQKTTQRENLTEARFSKVSNLNRFSKVY